MKKNRFIGDLSLLGDGESIIDIEFRHPIPDSHRPSVARALQDLAKQIEENSEKEFSA